MNFPVLHASLQHDLSGSLPSSVFAALKPPPHSSTSSTSSDVDLQIVGGVLKDTSYSWLARGSMFVVINSKTNLVVSIFDFNRSFPELRFIVTSCCSCDDLLIVGLKGQDGRGCVALYKPRISKLVKAIDIPYSVTAVEVVACRGGALSSLHSLCKSLRWLFGIVAVGTEEGHLYLLDLKFDSPGNIDNLPSQMEIVPPALKNVPKTREMIVGYDSFLAFEMQAACHEEGVFHYAQPDDEIIESFYPSDANITTILYEPRTTSLFVGFNFGQFQIFSLQNMTLVHSSDLQENIAPVLRFSFQEPENDPRKFCYLWVARGHKPGDISSNGNSEPLTLCMFQLMFIKKEIPKKSKQTDKESNHPFARVLYKDLEGCNLRFKHCLGTGLVSNVSKCCGSTLLMCSSIEEFAPELDRQDQMEDYVEYCASPSSSFCMFGWKSLQGKSSGRSELNVIIFDINRWYLAQMPSCFRRDEDDYIYAGMWTFDDDQLQLSEDESILGMHVPSEKIQHFNSGMKPLPDRFFLPSSCSFPLYYITNQSLNHYLMYGYQQQVLNTATELKSMCLVSPKEIHDDMLSSELYSKHSSHQQFTPDMMRENILTTALEHGQVSFLLSIVRDLASGHLAACGCTLRFVMDWAWKSVANVKDSIDKLCIPIFDCTCPTLDSLVQSQLQFHTTQVHHLKIVFQKLLEFTEDATDQSKEELKTKLNVVTLIHQYLKVVHWFINNGLLPEQLDNVENNEDIMTPSGILIYKYTRLREVFDQRRAELNRSNCPDLLLIDGWVEEIGEPLTSRWLKEEGGKVTFPPPSFMTLLDMYYLDCVNVTTKHCLVMYLLLDVLAMFSTLQNEAKCDIYESQRDRLNNIASFLHIFGVPERLIKLTEGFWLLDHKNFEAALEAFLDADTRQPASSWQERRILRSFLHQGHPEMALKYISVRCPRVETIEDAKMHITIFIMSREPLKAWDLVQMSVGQHNSKDLFSHLFTLSQKHSQLDQLLKLPFSQSEEDMVIKYLQESNSAEATQILVLYYLQHSRYVDAIKLHSQNKHNRLMRDQSEESRRRNAKLDHIVQSYSNLLPKIEREIAFSSSKFFKQQAIVRKEVHKPSALSSIVHPTKYMETSSRADRLVNQMNKIEEKQRNLQEPILTPLRRRPHPRILDTNQMNNSVFLYPTIDQSRKRRSIDIHGTMGRRSSFGSPACGQSHLNMSKLGPSTVAERRLSSLSVASMLLQTPPITRRRQSISQQDIRAEIQTPQSILKVKNFMKRERSPSPSISMISQSSSRINDNRTKMTNIGENESIDSESMTDDVEIKICDLGLESTVDDTAGWVTWQRRGVFDNTDIMRLHSTSIGSEGFSQLSQESEDRVKKHGIPTVSTPDAKSSKRPKLNSDTFTKENLNKMPTVTTPFAKISALKRFQSKTDVGETIQENKSALDTPKKLRFAGLDGSANDSGLSVVLSPPVEQVAGLPNLTPVRVSSETCEDHEMDVDITGDESIKQSSEEESDDEPAEISEIPIEGEVKQYEDEDDEEENNVLQLDEDNVEHIIEPSIYDDSGEVICLDDSSDDEQEQNDEEDLHPHSTEKESEIIEKPFHQDDQSLRLAVSLSEKSEESFDKNVVFQDVVLGGSTNLENPIETDNHSLKLVVSSSEESLQKDDIFQTRNEIDDEAERFEEPVQQADQSLMLVLSSSEESLGDENKFGSGEFTIEKDEVEQIQIIQSSEISHVSPNLDENFMSEEQDSEPIKKEEVSQVSHTREEELVEKDQSRLPHVLEDEVIAEEVEEGVKQVEILYVEESSEIEVVETKQSIAEVEIIEVPETKQEDLPTSDEEARMSPELVVPHTDKSIVINKDDKVTSDYRTMSVNKLEEIVTSPEAEKTQENEQISSATPEKEKPLISKEELAKVIEMEKSVKKIVEKIEVVETPVKVMDENISKVQIIVNPSTPVLERVREEPKFVLSPPTTRKSKRRGTTTKSTQYTPKPESPTRNKVPKSPSRITRSSKKQVEQDPAAPEPEFLFSPPKTRTRSTRKKDQSMATLSPPRSTTKRTRSQTKSHDTDSDRSVSPVLRSSSHKRNVKKRESSPEEKLDPPTTPSRKTRQSPGRKTAPATPTRSSSRVKAKLSIAKEMEKTSESELQMTDEASVSIKPVSTTKRNRTRKSSVSSDLGSSDSEVPLTPSRRSSRRSSTKSKKGWSPSQDKTKLVELTPLPEEEEETEETDMKKRKKVKTSESTRATRSTRSTTGSYPTRMRRKAKILTLDE
ncbi:uncharacterized protein LOC120328998 isoform X1 [Styela clava]